MAQTSVPYSNDYTQSYVGSAVGGLFGYNGTPVPFAPPTNGGAAGNAPSPFHETGTQLGDATTPTPAPATDPTAAATAAANANKLAAFNTQDQQALNTAGSSGDAAARSYGSSILDYLGGAQQTQNGINQEGTQAELSKQQASRSILDFVNHGIQSGGVMLGNKNASTSSAAEALARAYSTLGAHQQAQVGTQYAQDENKIGTEQTNLGIANATQGRHNEEYKANAVGGIVSAAQTAIANVKSNMQYASLPDQINMQQQIAQIQAEATAKLNALDHTFSEGVAAINPTDTNTRAGAAQNLALAGTAAGNPYQLTTQAPATFQGGAPAGGDLPIFTIPRSKATA